VHLPHEGGSNDGGTTPAGPIESPPADTTGGVSAPLGTDQNPGLHPHPQAVGGGSAPAQNASISIPHTSGNGGTAATASTSQSAGGGAYTVVSGDTMWDIAREHGISLSRLEALNPQIKNPDLIFPGQKINLGGSGGITAPAGPIESPPHGVTTPPVHLPGHDKGSGGATGPVESPPHGTGGQPVPLPHPGGGTSSGSTTPIESPPHGVTTPPVHLPHGGNGGLIDPAIKGPSNQLPNNDHNPKLPNQHPLHDPAARPRGGTDTGLFPKSSTYPPSDLNKDSQGLSRTERLLKKLKGWGNGTGNTAVDPAKKAVFVDTNKDTNPLHINDNNQNSHTA
jgi:spore coat assembly protein SafA